MIPQSASIEPYEIKNEEKKDGEIFAMVKGQPVYFTRKEAFTLVSMLIISLEVDANA